jgi:HTH-type transcriptional regulator/antitoxin HipB
MRIRTARDLGALIRDRRTTLGWSQQDLASRCGTSKRWVVGVEAGKPGAQIGLVLRALAALNLELTAGPTHRLGADALDALLDDLDADGP